MEKGRLLHIMTATLVETKIREIVCLGFVSMWEVTLYHGTANLKRAHRYRQGRQNILLEFLGAKIEFPITVQCDNMGVIFLSYNAKNSN